MKNKVTNQVYSTKSVISCNGQAQKSPHPLIYLNLLPKRKVACPYCSMQYLYQEKNSTK